MCEPQKQEAVNLRNFTHKLSFPNFYNLLKARTTSKPATAALLRARRRVPVCDTPRQHDKQVFLQIPARTETASRVAPLEKKKLALINVVDEKIFFANFISCLPTAPLLTCHH